jgi:hypothetical protein
VERSALIRIRRSNIPEKAQFLRRLAAGERAMTSTDSTIERAFELARSGACKTILEIRSQLKRERYGSVDSHLEGPVLRRQLTALMKASGGPMDLVAPSRQADSSD